MKRATRWRTSACGHVGVTTEAESDEGCLQAPSLPPTVDRATWQAELGALLVREKAHTREGNAIAVARRRLPMVEVDPATTLIGANGSVPLIDVFEGRLQLIAYFHMSHTSKPAAEQCEGCTFNTSQVRELSYLHSRDVTYPLVHLKEAPQQTGRERRRSLGLL